MENHEFVKLLQDYSDALNDRKRFAALLKDYFPEQPLKVNLILYLYDMNIHKEIEKAQILNNSFVYRFEKRLLNEHGVSKQNTEWAVNLWCSCYGDTILEKPIDISSADYDVIEDTEVVSEATPPTLAKQDYSQGEHDDRWRFEFDYEINDDGVTIVEYIEKQKKVIVVPSAIEGYPVIEIGESAFNNCDKVSRIMLPNSLKLISDNAFYGCSFDRITLPRGLTYIGNRAFTHCAFLESIKIPSNIESVMPSTFSYCFGLKNVILPKKMKKICYSAFSDCKRLEKIDIPLGTVGIEEEAFKHSGLRKIRIPDSVVSFGCWMPFLHDDIFGKDSKKEGITVYCNANSEAHKYARKHGIRIDDYENFNEGIL